MLARSQEPPPQKVRFSPRFVSYFSKWLTADRATVLQHIETGGLLFGAGGESNLVVQSFRDFSAPPSRREPFDWDWRVAFQNRQRAFASDNELKWLDVLGWFCVRLQSTGELLPQDVQFHNVHFSEANKLAVLFHSPIEGTIGADLYTPLPNSLLHVENHRRVSIRFSTEVNGSVPMVRSKLREEAFLKAYEIAGALDRAERWELWKEEYTGSSISNGFGGRFVGRFTRWSNSPLDHTHP